MGIQDMLAVLFGLKTAGAIDEYREGKAIQRELQSQADRSKWYMTHRTLVGKYDKERFSPQAQAQGLKAWAAVDPPDRLRPDRREGEARGGRAAGADLEASDLIDDVIRLYAADLAAGSVRRYVSALHLVRVRLGSDEQIAADHEQYDTWARDLRSRYGPAFEAIISAYNSRFLAYHELHAIRQNLGLVSKDPMAEDDDAPDWFDLSRFTDADWQELARRDAAIQAKRSTGKG